MRFEGNNSSVIITKTLNISFSIAEIRDIIFSLGNDWEAVCSSGTILTLALETASFYKRNSRLPELWDAIAVRRPHLGWETFDHKPPPIEEEPEPIIPPDPESRHALLMQLSARVSELNAIIIKLMALESGE